MKYNIPARTLRDWMKRLNIKSVFTHHSSSQSKEERGSSLDSNPDESNDVKMDDNSVRIRRPPSKLDDFTVFSFPISKKFIGPIFSLPYG